MATHEEKENEKENESEISRILEKLAVKIDELTKAVKDGNGLTEHKIDKESKDGTEILEKLTVKIDELTNVFKEKKTITEHKIMEHPLAYMIGAFAGGLIVGLLIEKGKEGKQ